jgi:hypothetical protein
MPISVIGAGFGRTGTFALKCALEHLGFGPCCHGLEERHFAQSSAFWRRVYNRESIDWDKFFDGYQSTVDSPSCRFYRELAEVFPNSKIILTVRDPVSWYESFCETVMPVMLARDGGKLFSYIFDGCKQDRQSMISTYERHNAEVQQVIPPHRLLVYHVQEGWEPLCQFLGVPAPSTPFPKVNVRTEFPLMLDRVLGQLEGTR